MFPNVPAKSLIQKASFLSHGGSHRFESYSAHHLFNGLAGLALRLRSVSTECKLGVNVKLFKKGLHRINPQLVVLNIDRARLMVMMPLHRFGIKAEQKVKKETQWQTESNFLVTSPPIPN